MTHPSSISVARPRRPVPNPRAPLAAFLSFLFPGLGQAYNGQAWLAWLLGVPALLVVAAVLVGGLALGGSVLSRMLDVRVLAGLIVLDLALLGWRLVAIAQAHGWRERFSMRRWTSGLTALLVLATVAMHALPAWYAFKAIDTIGAVSREGGGHTTETGATPLPEPSNQPDVTVGERVNVLLVGVDEAPGRSTFLTDTMLVLSIDPDSGRSAMISVPRDLYGVPLGDGRFFEAKLNALLATAGRQPDQYPLGGVGTLKAAIGELLGADIHYYAQINLFGFRDAIDTIGGVEVNVERAIADPVYDDPATGQRGFYLDTGVHHMNGDTALAFVRSRMGAGDTDFTRADRQQQLLTAVGRKLTAGNLLVALPGLLDAVKSSLSTDVPGSRFPSLAEVVQDSDLDDIERVVLTPPEYMTVDANSPAGYILHPDLDAIRELGRSLLTDDVRRARPSPPPPGDTSS
jgi:LCP family protein required for cell wall assembly